MTIYNAHRGANFFHPSQTHIDDWKGSLGLTLLHSPPSPLIDIIFVHGLGGGSRKTWSKSPSISDFWPQSWLPNDPAFAHVRIHTFGYDSDWANGKRNCMNIHHFARSLLGELFTSPCIANSDTSIVLVGHSMGGLVIKKAYILASQDPMYGELARRIQAIFFFGTPHRGSDSAKLLENILRITYSPREYVSELKKGSAVLQAINDEFRKYVDGVELWSLYETQKLAIGPLGVLIVDPGSATLGYPEEHRIPLHADHRSVCKFETTADPNYVTARNALALAVSGLEKQVLDFRETSLRSQLDHLQGYLGVRESLEDSLMLVEDTRMAGTCEWLASRSEFLSWKDFDADGSDILWLNAKPGSGKTVLTGYAIRQLQSSSADCSFYFFRHGEKLKSQLGSCLRSLAFQMACQDDEVRSLLSHMQKNGTKLDSDDGRIIWRTLFLNGIFKLKLRSQYWVIDALDECTDLSTGLETVLATLNKSIPLRVLFTSRSTPEIARYFAALGDGACQSVSITTEDTLPDVRRLLQERVKLLGFKGDERALLVDRIVEKSQGSFLWTSLVIKDLSECHSDHEINQVLEEVPRNMELYYQRSLDLMAHSNRGKDLSKAILMWTVCATRPLGTDELQFALGLDIEERFPNLRNSIVTLCGHLVTVDKYERVQLAHETVREFLLGLDPTSEFAIDREESHTRIARACLVYLTGEEMKPPRTRRGAIASARKRAPLSVYACSAFAYHLGQASPAADDVFELVGQFLKANVLSWIELIAQSMTLAPLISTARGLKLYFDACTTHRSQSDSSMKMIKGWTTDLVRIAARYADALTVSPSAIYSLLRPFCPTESTAHKTVIPGKSISVTGQLSSQWEDCLSCIELRHGRATALCYGKEFFAVGLFSGSVTVYHATSCQEHKSFHHGEMVLFVQIMSKRELLISCGLKTVRVWDIRSGQTVHNFKAPPRPIEMILHNDLLVLASSRNFLVTWELGNNGVQRRPGRHWNYRDEIGPNTHRWPCAISISVGHQMLAVAYPRKPVILWDLQEDAYYGACGKRGVSGATSADPIAALVFNPNPAIDRLAVAYQDGDLVLLDPFQDEVIIQLRSHCQNLTASPDGHLLAAVMGSGIIHVYEFETLSLLYRVKLSKTYIKQIAFCPDGFRFADIRGSHCNVWEPPGLLQDLASSSEDAPKVIESATTDAKGEITGIVIHASGAAICSGDDGSVSLYDSDCGMQRRTLYRHKCAVRFLTVSHSNIIMSVDVANVILTWKLEKAEQGWVAGEKLFESRLDCGVAVTQILSTDVAQKFILSTRQSDHLWNMRGEEQSERVPDRPGTRKWFDHPHEEHLVICLDDTEARIYTWTDWSEIASVDLTIDMTGLQIKRVIPCMSANTTHLLLETSELDGPPQSRGVCLLDAAPLASEPESSSHDGFEIITLDQDDLDTSMDKSSNAVLMQSLSRKTAVLGHHVAHIIGLRGPNKVVFLDTRSWVSTVDLDEPDDSRILYVRHFFVPHEWFAGMRNIIVALDQRDVLIARNSDLAVVRGGFEYAQVVAA
ncbi:NACHT and WD domain protein [Aspergillus heteromorphus CBS 117.55]|uniref:GPI inositol-deacylase n=1 Tax=Aspergillus heteromorphus CBS 117.55 TaxID=1448321 RepID=A0A317VME4_9EURO|nr:NACHT and WD domain protein [Aspergillus heteromorphus CBS 117.55]PWY75065.1 NACHT and WD domain protein [Aspergillus heteromorphus CBS 117.55]